jgi:hypothetical protein
MPVTGRRQGTGSKQLLTVRYFYLPSSAGLFKYLPRIVAPENGADFPNNRCAESVKENSELHALRGFAGF